jgi:hypothetical protein
MARLLGVAKYNERFGIPTGRREMHGDLHYKQGACSIEVVSFLLFASIPFTRLVHMFSFPVRYPTRGPQQYHARDGDRKNEGNKL